MKLLWLIAALTAVPTCFLQRNEAKFKKNLAVGVTFPKAGREDPEVLGLLAGYRRAQLCVCLGLLALAALGALLPKEGIGFLVLFLWIDLLIVAQFVVYARYNAKLKEVKRARGWTVPAVRAASVTAAAEPVKRVSVWWFIAAAVVAAAPAVFDRDTWFLYVLDGVMALTCWLGVRYLYRNRAETVDENEAVTQTLTRVRRRAWDRVWLLCAWMLAAIDVGMWLSMTFFPGGQAIIWLTVVLAVVVCAAAVGLEFRVRHIQEKLTVQSGEGFYIDEDDKWLWGQIYYDPNDSRTIVNNRTGVNSTVNIARPAGKAFAVFALALLFAGMPLMGVYLDAMGSAPLPLKIEDGTLIAANYGSRYEMPLEDIEAAELIDALPDGMIRVWGVGMDSILQGKFKTVWGDATLCLDPRTGPWLKVTMADGKLYLLGGGTSDTEAAYAALRG